VPDRPSTLERVVFFSDAVFAISITLLALDLRLPAVLVSDDNAGLLDALTRSEPQLFAFFLSFFIVGAFWIGHVRTLHSVTATNGGFIGLNLVFLFFVALLPFPTSVLAEHGDVPLSAVLYAVCVAAVGLAATALWLYASWVARLAPDLPDELIRGITVRTLVTPVLFVASIPIAFASPVGAEILWLLTFPATGLISRRLGLGHAIERSLSTESSAEEREP
jgi:uncharacterized membrane protein